MKWRIKQSEKQTASVCLHVCLKTTPDGKYEISDKIVTVGPDTDMATAAKSIHLANNRKVGR